MRTTTYLMPATTPAKLTMPGATARTGVPVATAKVMPRWPEHQVHSGASKGSTTAPSTGGRKHVAARTNTASMRRWAHSGHAGGRHPRAELQHCLGVDLADTTLGHTEDA